MGTHTLSATFTPADTKDCTDATATVTLVVEPRATITTLTATSTDPSSLAAPVTFQVSVTGGDSGGGLPSGKVQLVDETTGALLAQGTLRNGTVALATTLPAGRGDEIVALYLGSADFAASSSAAWDGVVL